MSTETYDLIIIGAGLSGIGAAYHIMDKCPDKKFAILEARENMGGTWDLFKYPGIRSDSDMYTLGFSFNPWVDAKSIADGPSILQYIKDTASKFGIDKKILFNHKVLDASWDDATNIWTLTIDCESHQKTIQSNFIFSCSGYYDYNKGYEPEFPGIENFKGTRVHPQKWPEDLNYEGKKIVVIGSGATAVTLVPELSKKAEKVSMLQRSPTYIMSLPRKDKLAERIKKIFSAKTAYRLIRWKNIRIGQLFYQACQRWPNMMKKYILKKAKAQLNEDFDMRHFDPKYGPWDQRLCVVPNGDLFKTIRSGKANVVTDTIKTFTEKGILLESGIELEADIIITATGLRLQLLGGMTIHVNGKLASPQDIHCYKGVMFSGIPNFAVAIGYTNASWTLKCDLSCYYVTRILNYMKAKNYAVCLPKFDPNEFKSEPLLDFDAGYVKRAADVLPKQGSKAPWKLYQNYFKDAYTLKKAKAVDKYLEFR
jgi:cation diffusion facilitator CzcD-associated flavoprotein CzcO